MGYPTTDMMAELALHVAGVADKILIGVPDGIICPPDGWSGCDWTPREDDRWTICIWHTDGWTSDFMLDHKGRLVR